MKNFYSYFKNIGFSLFLILFVTVPVIYFLGIFSQDAGFRFYHYDYFIDEKEYSEFNNDLFTDNARQKIDLGIQQDYLYLKIDLSEFK